MVGVLKLSQRKKTLKIYLRSLLILMTLAMKSLYDTNINKFKFSIVRHR